jgi:hypothetical protein
MTCPTCSAVLADDASSCSACGSAVPRAHGAPARPLDPDDALLVVKEFLRSLSAADRVTVPATSMMFLACFFPWRETAGEGAVLGLMSLGVVVFLLSLGALALVVLRSRHTGQRRDPFLLWLLQLGAVGAALLVCVIYAVSSVDVTAVPGRPGTEAAWASRPAFGLGLALLAGLVAAGGTLASLPARRRASG